MKIIITEEQNKKLFIPRKIDEREKQFLTAIKFDPVIDFMRENDAIITFDMSTSPDEWRWETHDISTTINGKYEYLGNFDKPVMELIKSIAENIEGVFHMWGEISLQDNKLHVTYDYEMISLGRGGKTYQL